MVRRIAALSFSALMACRFEEDAVKGIGNEVEFSRSRILDQQATSVSPASDNAVSLKS
jgi:hypothetical protein